MNNKSEIREEIRKAMEFYRELGFEYLPVMNTDVARLLNAPAVKDDSNVLSHQRTKDKNVHIGNKEALSYLREEIGDCRRCRLSEGRKNIVFGEGSPDADLMFIGEGPGREEDVQARPFVGDAGKLLTRMIIKLGLKREDVYIANIVKCRPPYNRNPENDEIAVCRPFVEKQIDIIKPKVIVCLGKISANALLKVNVPISRLRGSFYQFKNIPVMPTFHPAYLMRNPKDKWLTWDDMQKVLEKINSSAD